VNNNDNDIFFAMRGAGSSFAIATEFLYQIYRRPETSPAVILVLINDKRDLWKIQEATYDTSKYSIAINNEYVGDFKSIKILQREGATPLFLTVTDIRWVLRADVFPSQDDY
jgi:hypothetical protein